MPQMKTQLSTKDAGGFEVTTYLTYDDVDFFMVDNIQVDKSFTVGPGKIKPIADIVVNEAKVFATDSVYTLEFYCQHLLPKGALLEINMP